MPTPPAGRSGPSRARPGTPLLLLAVAAGVAATFFLAPPRGTRSPEAPDPFHGSGGREGRESAASPSPLPRVPHRLQEVAEPQGPLRFTVQVRAPGAAPAAAAEVHGLPALRRVGGRRILLGRTSAEGLLVVEAADVGERVRAVYARYGDMVSPLREVEEGEDAVTLLLQPTHTLAFLCRDLEGAPVEGVHLFLCRERPPPLASLLESGAGPPGEGPPDLEILRLATDGAGQAAAMGLLQGQYFLRLHSATHAAAEGTRLRLAVPGPPVEITMVEPLGAAVAVLGDRLQAQMYRYPDGTQGPFGLTAENYHLYRRILQERFPQADLVFVTVPAGKGAPPASFTPQVLLREAGEVQFEVPLQPLSRIQEVFAFDALALARAEDHVEVTFHVLDPDGNPWEGVELAIMEESQRPPWEQLTIPVRHGRTLRLAPGRYQGVATDPTRRWLAQAIGTVDVHGFAAQEFEVRLPSRLRELRFDVEGVSPPETFPARVRVRGQGFDCGGLFVRSLADCVYLVPAIQLDVAVSALGGARWGRRVDAADGAADGEPLVVSVPAVQAKRR